MYVSQEIKWMKKMLKIENYKIKLQLSGFLTYFLKQTWFAGHKGVMKIRNLAKQN